MSPTIVTAFRIRKRHLAALAALLFLSFFLARLIEDRNSRQAVAAMAPALANRVIVVDPGHGGIDPGAVGKDGLLEKDITLTVGKRLAANLGQAGAMVLLTRETDTDLSDSTTLGAAAKKREDLQRRVALANDNQADLYVSIHVNSFASPDRRGAQTFVQPGKEDSLKASRYIQAELARLLRNTTRQPAEVDYYVTKNTAMPAVVVEIGFLTNDAEAKLLGDPAYQGKVAWAIYAGLVKYFSEQGPPARETTGREEIIKTFKENATKGLRP
ncbi:Germination-specific N-acetylmuramoyl-L-alanine amidase precursor [Pelotomaculum schinkii]|uniref:Germination-specific N-acetylmuramoyl-L-alanine amidase n=1 Tax=Pelotomaculum schinkii TaxID=78350 RepID=A0A4Y7RHK2_9FIRM|nr:N-acetylmuramoyl-L-alanine amidase CwlD [Pelotomaculum schinkii]TEB08239.1 Germination-specific N-acetylmuramoyl-L-alanine amidase precursor [Pelotomaculum schinkii]